MAEAEKSADLQSTSWRPREEPMLQLESKGRKRLLFQLSAVGGRVLGFWWCCCVRLFN